jgi:hypothetical protein
MQTSKFLMKTMGTHQGRLEGGQGRGAKYQGPGVLRGGPGVLRALLYVCPKFI